MRFDELNINEYDTFKQRSQPTQVSHGGSLARGGKDWRAAAAGNLPDQILQRKKERAAAQRAAAQGTNIPTTGQATGQAVTTDPDAPNNPGSTGKLKFSDKALTSLNGEQSDMTVGTADSAMRSTLRRAQQMADNFGGEITINDAIARRGSSREVQTRGSQHFQGTALDVSTAGMSNQQKLQLYNAAITAGFTGFGFGVNILHVDTGPRRFWSYGNRGYGGVQVASLGRLAKTNRRIAINQPTAVV